MAAYKKEAAGIAQGSGTVAAQLERVLAEAMDKIQASIAKTKSLKVSFVCLLSVAEQIGACCAAGSSEHCAEKDAPHQHLRCSHTAALVSCRNAGA